MKLAIGRLYEIEGSLVRLEGRFPRYGEPLLGRGLNYRFVALARNGNTAAYVWSGSYMRGKKGRVGPAKDLVLYVGLEWKSAEYERLLKGDALF